MPHARLIVDYRPRLKKCQGSATLSQHVRNNFAKTARHPAHRIEISAGVANHGLTTAKFGLTTVKFGLTTLPSRVHHAPRFPNFPGKCSIATQLSANNRPAVGRRVFEGKILGSATYVRFSIHGPNLVYVTVTQVLMDVVKRAWSCSA